MLGLFLKFSFYLSLFSTICGANEIITTRLRPVDFLNRNYALCKGMPGVLKLDLRGSRVALAKHQIGLEISMPGEYVEPILATYSLSVQGERGYLPDKIIQIDKNRWLVEFNPEATRWIQEKTFSPMSAVLLVLRAKGKVAENLTIKYAITIDGHKKDDKIFKIDIIPQIAMDRKPADNFRIEILEGVTQQFPTDSGVSQAYNQYILSLASRPSLRPFRYSQFLKPPQLACYGKFFDASFMVFARCTPSLYNMRWDANQQAVKTMQLARKDNGDLITHVGLPCAEIPYVIDDPAGLIWDKLMPEYIRYWTKAYHDACKTYVLNFEPGPLFSELTATPVNRAAFAKAMGLKKTPSIAELQTSEYYGLWFLFRKNQNTQIVKNFTTSIRKHFPDTKVFLCTEALFDTYGERPYSGVHPNCAVDCVELDNIVDGFMNMNYSAGRRFYERAKFNAYPKLKKTQIMTINPAQCSQEFFNRYNDRTTAQNILVLAALGYTGVAFWPDFTFVDGLYFTSVASVFDAIARTDDAYKYPAPADRYEFKLLNNPKLEIKDGNNMIRAAMFPDFESDVVAFLHRSSSGDFVASLFNFNQEKTAYVSLKIKDYLPRQGYFVDILSRSEYVNAKPKEGILIIIPPEESVLLITNSDEELRSNIVTQCEIALKMNEDISQTVITEFGDAKGKIAWDVFESDRSLAIRMSSADGSTVMISPTSSTIRKWEYRGRELLSQECKIGLGEFLFLDPRQQKPSFRLEEYFVKDGNPGLKFTARVSLSDTADPEANYLDGLVIQRTITFRPGKICIETTLHNTSPRKMSMQVDCRIRSAPLPGAISGIARLREIIKDGVKLPERSFVLLKDGARAPGFEKFTKKWMGEAISFHGNSEEKLNFLFGSSFSGVYCWRSQNLSTIEGISLLGRLDYEESRSLMLTIKAE